MSRKALVQILIVLYFISGGLAYAQKVEKQVSKNFSSADADLLHIESKFGAVNLMSNDSEEINVEAILWVSSSDDEKAKELLDRLDVEIFREGNRIVVRSLMPERLTGSNKTKFGIDFNIEAPSFMNLELNSKYGSAYIEELSGHANIDISYGNLKIMELNRGNKKPLNLLNMAYSSGSIEEAGWLKAELAYSKVNIEEAEVFMVISKYSGFNVEECSSLVSDSKYDTYKIGELNNYVGELKYANLSISELMSKLDVKSTYSTIKIDEVSEDFKELVIDNRRGSVKIMIEETASFNLQGEAKRGDISVSGMDNLDKRVENADKYYKGSHGSNPQSKVDILITEGSAKLVLD